MCDHCEVKGRLGKKKEKERSMSLAWLQKGPVCADHLGPIRYLSLVVLHVEEGVMAGQFDHLVGVLCGFMNDGQVEKPERKTGKKGKG